MHIVNHIPLNFGVGYVKVVLDSGTAQREGLGGGTLTPPFFCKNKSKLNI